MAELFVGRQREIEILKEAVCGPTDSLRLVLVTGDAGVGKTRLLQEFPSQAGPLSNESYLVAESIIDFDEARYRLPDGLSLEIAQQLGGGDFQYYLDIIKELRQVEKRGASPERLFRLSLDADEMFFECLHKVTSRKRVVLRFDTVEKVSTPSSSNVEKVSSSHPATAESIEFDYTHPFFRFLETVVRLSNLVMIAAGRTKATELLYKPLLEKFGEANVAWLPLSPMGLEDSRKILQDGQKKRALIIDQTWEIILHYLSGGFPIILDMALEWVEGDSANAAKWLSIENLNKLVHEVGRMEDSRVQLARQEDLKLLSEEALVHLQTAFRHELVSHVSKLKSKDDVLTLTLAKVNPLDIEGIAEVLDVSEQTAKALFERARKRANVKILPDGRIRLTDAMEDLVKLYVWPEVDLEGTRERRDSLRALKYLSRRSDKYLEEIQTLRDQEFAIPHDELFRINQLYNERLAKEQEFWIARTERLERQLFLDPQTGFEDFNKDFDLAAQFGYLVARDSLIRVVRPYVEKLGTLDRLSFQGRLAQHLVRKGQYIDASRIYEQITKEVNPGTKEMVDALIGQGTCLMRAKGGPGLGPSIRRATSKFREALHIASNAEAEQWGRGVVEVQKARALLSLGWAYRAWGLLNESQDFYQRCYRLSLKSGNAVYQALSANGMAYVFSILKDETHAKNYSDETIDIWKKLILEHPEHTEEYRNRLAQAYNTAGEIWIELSQPLLAGRFFQVAVDIFSELSIDEWLSRAVSGRGWARWMLGKTKVLANDTNESVSIDWESALADLEHANELATSLDAPLVLHRLAHTLWDLGQKDQAVNRWIESNRQARQVGDLFTEYNGLCDMANAITETSIPGYSGWIDFQSAREQYFSRNSEVYFPVLDGLFFTYVGNMALLAHEPDVAVQHYKRGLGILCKHFTYLDYNIRGQLKFIHERILPRATVEDMRYVGREMLAFWQRPDSPEELSAPDALGFFMDWSSLKPPREL